MKTLVASCLLLLACRTEFVGSAHIDPGTCQAKCQALNMQVGGMVFMGEYSSACVCEVPRAAPPPPSAASPGASAAAGAAAAGVIMQARRDEDAQNQHH